MITQNAHLPAALASDRVHLIGLVDPVLARAAGVARTFGLKVAVERSIEPLLGSIDGAIIATPNHTHRDIAVTCLNAGVSTLIEKPLAVTVTEGEDIELTALAAGATVAVGYTSRFLESTVLLKDLLEAGYFGRVRRFAHQFGTVGGWAPLSAYNLDLKAAGGGVLVVTGSHFLDRMLYLWGQPEAVEYEDDSAGGPEANCIAVFHFDRDGARFEGAGVYSKTTELPPGLVIETDCGFITVRDCDEAAIRWEPVDAPGLRNFVERRGSRRFAPAVPPSLLQLEDFVEACRQRRPPLVDAHQGVESLRLIARLYASRRPTHTSWYPSAPAEAGRA
jgi:predicted dehydrogenase